jgi:hypothetical protein
MNVLDLGSKRKLAPSWAPTTSGLAPAATAAEAWAARCCGVGLPSVQRRDAAVGGRIE